MRRLVPWTEPAAAPNLLEAPPAEDPTPEEEQHWAQQSRDFLDGEAEQHPPDDELNQFEAPSGADFTFFESLPELSHAEARPPELLANRSLADDLCELNRLFAPAASQERTPARPLPATSASPIAHEDDPEISELRDLLVQRDTSQQLQQLANDPDGCAAFWEEALHPTTSALSSTATRRASRPSTPAEGAPVVPQQPASLTRLQSATVRRNRANAHAKKQARKAQNRPRWNITTATSNAFQVPATSSDSSAPLPAWQQERTVANREYALARKAELDSNLATLFEAPKDEDVEREQEGAEPSPQSPPHAPACPLAEAPATTATPDEEHGAVAATDAVSDEADVTTAAETARATDDAHAADDTSSPDLENLRDLTELADFGAKVLWPPGYDHRTAFQALAADAEARKRLAATTLSTAPTADSASPQSSSPLTNLARRVSPTDAPT